MVARWTEEAAPYGVDGVTDIEVTEADISAAKLYLQGAGPWAFDEIRIGEGDSLVQAFAKHRIAHTDALKAEIERLQRSADSWEADALRYAQNAEYWKAELMKYKWALGGTIIWETP